MYARVLYGENVTGLYAELLNLLMEREIGREYLDAYEMFLRQVLQPYEIEEYERLKAFSEVEESYEPLYQFCKDYKLIIKLPNYEDCKEVVDFEAQHRRILELNDSIDLKKKELIEAIIQFLKKHA